MEFLFKYNELFNEILYDILLQYCFYHMEQLFKNKTMNLFIGTMLLYTEKNDIAEFADIKSKTLSLTTYNETETNISKLSLQFVNNLCENLNFDNYDMNIAFNYLSDSTLTVPSILSTPNTFSANASVDKSTPHIETLIRPKTPDTLTLDQIAQYSPNSSAQPTPEPHVTPSSNNYNNQQVKLQMNEVYIYSKITNDIPPLLNRRIVIMNRKKIIILKMN